MKQVQFDGLDEAALALKSLVECANFDRYLRSVTALRYGHVSLRPYKIPPHDDLQDFKMALDREQYDRQRLRFERAVADLRTGGSLLHAIARSYYLVYATASYAATIQGVTVTHARHGQEDARDNFTHNAMADVVQALYTGNKYGRVSPGQTPGIGEGHFTNREAARRVDLLQQDRKSADYGPTREHEPYTAEETDERVTWAKMLVEDLGRLI